MQCLSSGNQMNGMDQEVQSSGATSRYSSPNFVAEQRINNAGIEEAELSLQGGGSLNYEVCASSIA